MDAVPIDEAYFNWLCGQVGQVQVRETSRTYRRLLRLLYDKEFVWIVAHDDNRMDDGRALRYEFVNNLRLDVDPQWMSLGCSFFEMLVALSRRVSFLDDGTPAEWFWHLIENLELNIFNDRIQIDPQDVNEILDEVIWRTYEPSGQGGLFPLKRPRSDQRKADLWCQMNAYLLENDR
jgi:hypothetical protein